VLVLQRHENESVVIGLPDGREIIVMVTEIRFDKVKLGFEAPLDITVHRQEVADEIKRENRAAAQAKAE
jgi:carbon storage regulator